MSIRAAVSIIVLAIPTGTASALTLDNATDLQAYLARGRTALSLQELKVERGCGPNGCSVMVGDFSILPKKAQILGANRRPVRIRTYAGLPTLELDWYPLAAYRVIDLGHDWGLCLEFTHSGLGSSGSLQRWGTVMLIPNRTQVGRQHAFRFTGYWNGCANLSTDGGRGGVVFSEVERVSEKGDIAELGVIQHRCLQNHCQRIESRNITRLRVSSDAGALELLDR